MMADGQEYYVGIDIGSTASKTVIMQGEKVIDAFTLPTGWNGREISELIYSKLQEKGYQKAMRCIATGYGRVCVDYADKVVTEITCHGRGAWALFGKNCTVIDIGGQDTKMINIENGQVRDFLMNDKCAAGTGKFIEVMATRLGAGLEEMYELARNGQPLAISSMCTVFAESEVISHIGAGKKREDIVAGVIESVANRVAGMANRFGAGDTIVLTGGLSVSPYFIEILSKKLGKDEYTIVYDFSSEGQQDVTITYNADPSVSCTVTVTVQAAYDGKRIAVFIGSAYCPYVGNYDSTYAEFFVSKDCEGISYNNSIYQILPSSELNTVRKSEGADGINYPTNSPLGIKMAKLRAQNQAITAEALHDSSDGYTLSDVDKIVETIQENKKNNFRVKSFIIAEVTMDNVEDLTTANKEAAKQLDQMLYEEIDQKAPEVDDTFEVTLENGETVEMEFQYAPSLLSPSVAMIREHMGGMNFKYYAVVELFGLSRQKQN